MSRKIKFRAWSNEHNRYCDLIKMDEDDRWYGYIYSCAVYLSTKDIILEQYTGLKDKNGKEIYVGDIVEIDKYGKFQIIWNEWACKFDFDKIGKREQEEPLLSQDWEEKTEVIGNIHENKELLGDKG